MSIMRGLGATNTLCDGIARLRRGPTKLAAETKRIVAIDTALADAGYNTGHNHCLCRAKLGVRRTVIRLNGRNTGGGVGRRRPAARDV
jgi:hypothetical protein